MSEKHTILKGTFILTATGFLSRFIGFFYRMFLSHTFGEESVGLYQLIFPIYALCFSLTTAGIEVALSRCVARKVALSRHKEARQLLYVGLFLSIALSTVTAAILQTNASAFSILAIYAVNHYSLRSLIRFLSHLSTVVSADTISGESRQKFRHSHNLSNKLHESSVYMSYI